MENTNERQEVERDSTQLERLINERVSYWGPRTKSFRVKNTDRVALILESEWNWPRWEGDTNHRWHMRGWLTTVSLDKKYDNIRVGEAHWIHYQYSDCSQHGVIFSGGAELTKEGLEIKGALHSSYDYSYSERIYKLINPKK